MCEPNGRLYVLVHLALLTLITSNVNCWGQESTPLERRAVEIAQWLPETARGVGQPISNREAWEKLANHPVFRDYVELAEQAIDEPIPQLTDELYLEFSRNGNRTNYEAQDKALTERLRVTVLAECIEDKGRFIDDIEARIRQTCQLKAWTLPAHDGALKCFKGHEYIVNIQCARKAWDMACYSWVLGDRLSGETQSLIRRNVERRVLEPAKQMYLGQQKRHTWVYSKGNHNPVCHSRVTGAALALLDDREERALYLAAAEHFSQNYLNGFTADGYCSEGLHYWNYGFGRFLTLVETAHQATEGKLDLLQLPNAESAAKFGWNTQLTQKLSPAFSDCHVDEIPNPDMVWYIGRRLVLPSGVSNYVPGAGDTVLPDNLIYAFPNSATAVDLAPTSGGLALRSWFADGQLLITRPASKSDGILSVAMKGGHNAEFHNHNDVGSFVVAVRDEALIVDPGREIYTRKTFGKNRYDRATNNSFGHSVPVVANKLQRAGRQARARIVRKEFSPESDYLEIDYASAYDVNALESLTRSFHYDRHGQGGLTIRDRVRFATPNDFESAIISFGEVELLSDDTFLIIGRSEALKVSFDSPNESYEITHHAIEEDYHAGKHPTRISVRVVHPVKIAELNMLIEPWGGELSP